MRKSKFILLTLSSLFLCACSNNTSYNEAELIRKIDELQHTVELLSNKLNQIESQVNLHENQLTTTITTTTPMIDTTTKKQTTKKMTTKKQITTKPNSSSSIHTTSKSEYKNAEFLQQVEHYKKQISTLSQTIASSTPKSEEKERKEQFTLYQQEIKDLYTLIEEYKTILNVDYLENKMNSEEFQDVEQTLNKLNDALFKLEDQLKFKFEGNK